MDKTFKKKLKLRNKTKGQSTLEFAILVFCIVAALVAMQAYIKRGIQGKLRQTADEIGTPYAPGETAGTSSKVFNRTTQVNVYTELGEVIAPGTAETVEGRYTYRREDILQESMQENVNETVD